MIIEKVITSSVLILAILLIRALFQKKISPVIVYALWFLAAVRILWPGMIGTSPLSIMNTGLWKAGREAIIKESSRQSREYKDRKYQEYLKRMMERWEQESSGPDAMNGMEESRTAIESGASAKEIETHEIVLTSWQDSTFFGKLRFWVVRFWFIGMAVIAIIFIRQNLILHGYLKRTGKKLREVSVGKWKISVFVAGDKLPSPCLFGLFPAIYIPERCICENVNTDNSPFELTGKSEERVSLILEHELAHYRHGDFIWSLVRILCLVTAWYNPLVWLAAKLSVRDGELACDRSCLKRLGGEKWICYGETLLAMITPVKERGVMLWHATMMTSDGKFMKKRIERIVENKKNSMTAVIAVLILAAFCAGAVFTESERVEERTANTAF